MEKVVRKLAVCCLLLFAFVGSALAQRNDPYYVIKRGNHFLGHVKVTQTNPDTTYWVLKDVTTFHPDSCLWRSGNTTDITGVNHNYYFHDGTNYRFLSAPLAPDTTLSMSDSLPSSQLLRNTEQIYYFYDWDWDNKPIDGAGVARGLEHSMSNGCSYDLSDDGTECWEVYWVEYNTTRQMWRTSVNHSYHMTPNSGQFRLVTITEHDLEILNESGGLTDLTLEMEEMEQDQSQTVTATITSPYQYDTIQPYTSYTFGEISGNTHTDYAYYYFEGDNGNHSQSPAAQHVTNTGTPSYQWSLSGDAAGSLTLTPASDNQSATLTYNGTPPDYHQTATVKLKVTYQNGATQERTVTVLVKTVCHNPTQSVAPVVLYDFVTVSWHETADSYILTWTKSSDTEWSNATSVTVVGSESYTITGLDYNTNYKYKVTADCNTGEIFEYNFKTGSEPGLLVFGAVYGGGRMANVGGKTEIAIINCDSIHAVYGGNDIAGVVLDTIAANHTAGYASANITLGVDASDDAGSYSHEYNDNKASEKVRIGDVYGGGNGYYAYNGVSFAAATTDTDTIAVLPGDSVSYMTPMFTVGKSEYTNTNSVNDTLVLPRISKTAITVSNNSVKIDSLFGGAKNAFLTYDDYHYAGDSIHIKGGTILAVFGGNNIGGGQGYGKHYIQVDSTKIYLHDSIVNTATTGYGRDFGIRYLFGGGNKVYGSTTVVVINGGQCDTIFGGGNEADVYRANMTVNVPIAANTGSGVKFGRVYSEAISQYDPDKDSIAIKPNYKWDGINGIYNVRTLFGGNNHASMESVPTITLTSGSIGTAYGGGNAGDMLSHEVDWNDLAPNDTVKYGTYIEMNSPKIVVDYLYGGCQMSNVDFSTWVELQNGHVGTVYGGCNVSGDVGSSKVYPDAPGPKSLEYQAVQGATYVRASGGTVYRDLFAGSNGYYHCNDNIYYIEGMNYADPEGQYIGYPIPTHNETYAIIKPGVTIKGNVYAGGNLAPVGFTNLTVNHNTFPTFVGLTSLRMEGGTVEGDVYGGGNMATVFGSNEVRVSGGVIGGALYGGNDKLGTVAQITNHIFPDSYNFASDSCTSLTEVRTYVSVTGRPDINTVYGGGNGDYNYDPDANVFCDVTLKPIQSHTFVDINIDGYPDGDVQGGHINTVYGGGNGVTVTGSTTVFLNVKGQNGGEPVAYDHVGTIFGGNNKGSLDILADVILLKGQVNTVYGGCNQGTMNGDKTYKVKFANDSDSTAFEHLSSVVRLRNEYPAKTATGQDTIIAPTAVVSHAVYAGCRMNNVTNNSLVIVEGGNHTDTTMIFGGCDISGDVKGNDRNSGVLIVSGTHNNGPTVGDVYGGGNGQYEYDGNKAYPYGDVNHEHLIDSLRVGTLQEPYSKYSFVEMQGGTAANLYGGGLAGPCGETSVLVEGGTVNHSVYGGGKEAGTEIKHAITTTGGGNNNTNLVTSTGNSNVTIEGGLVKYGIYGGCHNSGTIQGNVFVNVYGQVGLPNDSIDDGIYGGGFGVATRTARNVTVTVDKKNSDADAPLIYGDVYGGSAFGQVNNVDEPHGYTEVDFNDGTLFGYLYGGGKGSDSDSTLVNGKVKVNINGGNLRGDIYGGCNYKGGVTGDIAVNVKSGTVGSNLSDACATADVFGGGFGHSTATSGNVVVTIDTINSTTPAPIIYGDVYGGSGYGDVNELNANDSTIVNVLNGTIAKISCDGGTTYFGGSVYGGGLGQNQIGEDPNTIYPAHVNGKVFVNIGKGEASTGCDPVLSGNATIEGEVYGCNNVNGTPLDSVFVNIYKTAHVSNPNNYYIEIPNTGLETETDSLNWLKNLPHDTVNYAISSVFGGGNRAAYTPPLTEAGLPRCATVHVWGCKENTIYDVYGGGNAANVGDTTANGKPANTQVIIDGGRIHQMFGGGNGYSATANHEDPSAPNYNPGANIFGTASSHVLAGLIDEVYGGANQWGSIDTIDLNVMSTPCCGAAIYGKVFGCANEAPINHSIATTVGCGVGPIGELYGGSNLADIGMDDNTEANVTLNVYGGKYQSVFGGSKGRRPGTNNESDLGKTAHIHGNVTLNIYGGTIVKAFGGSDQYGNVFGTITVNVDTIQPSCPAVIDTVFGAGNLTYYTPSKVDGQLITSPRVNIINGTVRKAVYGAGMGETAITRANPLVIIGDTVATHSNNASRLAIVGNEDGVGDVYGGGYAGVVKGGPTVNVLKSNTVVRHRVFGGGDMASIDSTLTTTVNVYNGTIGSGIYGGCHTTGTVADSIAVNIYGGVLGTAEAKMPEGIFGGGFGNQTQTDDNIAVNIGDGTYAPNVYADVYGGSAFGEVGATGKLAKVHLKNGTVYGKMFGGGKGSDTYSATVTGHTELAIESSVMDSIFGGCNVHGVVEGNTFVNIMEHGVLGAEQVGVQGQDGYKPEIRANAYGGGLGENTKVKGNVDVTVEGNSNNTSPLVYGDVYGGSAMGLVNCNDAGDAQNGYAKTDVTLNSGTIHGSLYGGGHGLQDKSANVWGPVTVTVEGGRVTNVFGCNNVKGAPRDSVMVLVTGGEMDSIFGGGNVAAYVSPSSVGTEKFPLVHVSGGDVKYKVVGGGNAADVNGNPYVLISDRTVGETTTSPTIGTSDNTAIVKGVFGGCNSSGIVDGNTLVELTGGIVGQLGTPENRDHQANIHGGGYGQPTEVHGNVTVNFGKVIIDEITEKEVHTPTPTLYGDLYGGSALGKVNTANDITTVNLLNGSIKRYHKTIDGADSLFYSRAFGGGLGVKGSGSAGVPAYVYGKVQVNVGNATDEDDEATYTGQADLVGCEVYGCNNQNGSPQQEVFVDVYQTKHIPSDSVHNTGGLSYAIYQVFGGGNESNYTITEKNVDVYVHKCENTAWRVFGAGNAADVYGVRIKIDGGRFDWVFGGGNGERGPEYAANIQDSIVLLTGGGYITNLVGGSNLNGTAGSIREGTYPGCSETEIYNYFLGSNSDTIVGNIEATINCEPENAMSYVNLYCGSNLAPIYGNVNVTISGGRFDNVFGGSKGSRNNPNNPPGYETYASNIHDNEDTEEIEGHVNLLIKGGAIGNLYGACDENGNVDGKITITVHDECSECGFYIGNIYGGGNNTKYQPVNITNGSGSTYSPEIKIIKGEIGGWTNKLPVHNPNHIPDTTYAGNVFGGGNNDSVVCNRTTIVGPRVIVGDGSNTTPVTVKGNVFGGGNNGNVVGSPVVVVEPLTHNLTVETPTNGTIQVTNRINQPLSGDIVVGEGLDVNIKAVPAAGYRFTGWSVTEGNGHIMKPNEASTIFTMGTQNTKIKATFEQQ